MKTRPWLQVPDGVFQLVLGLVEFGDGLEIVQPRPGQVLLGLDGFQDDADGEFFARLGQTQSFLRRRERARGSLDLVGCRAQASEGFDNLPADFVPELLFGQPGPSQAGLGSLVAAEIEQTPRPDTPADADKVILLPTK